MYRRVCGLILTLQQINTIQRKSERYQTLVLAEPKVNVDVFIPSLCPMTDPDACLSPPRCCSLWCRLPRALWSVSQTDRQTLFSPYPSISLVTCFSGTIWALYKTAHASPHLSFYLVCNFAPFPRSLSSHSVGFAVAAPGLY